MGDPHPCPANERDILRQASPKLMGNGEQMYFLTQAMFAILLVVEMVQEPIG